MFRNEEWATKFIDLLMDLPARNYFKEVVLGALESEILNESTERRINSEVSKLEKSTRGSK